jgi:hypothetical protein
MLNRPSKDLVEVFGYSPADLSSVCRSLWKLEACPFINKACTKTNHDKSIVYGTCSVTSPFGDCVVCPNRLYANNYECLRKIAAEVFGDKIEFFTYEEFIPVRQKVDTCVVALGHNSGREVNISGHLSMDWVLAKIKCGQLVEYVGVEVQSIDITGNYRDCWYAYKNLKPSAVNIPASEHGMNWANVHKRLIPQLIRKGLMYSRSSLVKKGLYFILPDIVYKKFEEIIGSDITKKRSSAADILTVQTYALSPEALPGEQRRLILKRNFKFTLSDFSKRFISGPNLPSGDELDDAVRKVLGLGGLG